MNLSTPGAPQPAQPEGAVWDFLRWLLEPPVGPQSTGLRVLRWLLRAGAFIVLCCVVEEIRPDYGPGSLDTFDLSPLGNADVEPKGGKPGKPPAA